MTGALAGYLVLLVAVMAIFWPAVRDSADLQSFMRDLPAGVKAMIGDADCATAAGFLGGELFSSMVPLLMLVAWPFGALALLAGCATGRRSTATAVTVAVAAIAYLMHALAPLVDTLDGWDVLFAVLVVRRRHGAHAGTDRRPRDRSDWGRGGPVRCCGRGP